MDAATAAALVLACAESSLPRSAADLLTMAAELGRGADGCGVPKKDLVDAADKLSQADDASRMDSVAELGRAAAALGERAATLARACDGFGRLVTAIKKVRDGMEVEVAPPRSCAKRIVAWWSRWRRNQGNNEVDLEAHLLSKKHQGEPGGDLSAAVQGNDRGSSRCSAMHNSALFGSLTMLPYMGSDGVLKVYSSLYRRCVGATFAGWWCFVGLCVPCTFVRSRHQRLYARLFSRIGMLGLTILVILFCYWSLFPDWTVGVSLLLAVAVALHIWVFIWSCKDGDM